MAGDRYVFRLGIAGVGGTFRRAGLLECELAPRRRGIAYPLQVLVEGLYSLPSVE